MSVNPPALGTGPRLLSLCSGIGGLDLAVEQHFGAKLVAFSENDAPATSIMERHWPGMPNIGDLKVADWASLGQIDIVCGGIPCQPWSAAGKLGRTEDDRHLWPHVAVAIRLLRPRYVIVEEVAGFLAPGGLDAVLADLSALGFDAEWTTVRASDVGACHRRERAFLLAWDASREQVGTTGFAWSGSDGFSADTDGERFSRRTESDERTEQSGLGTSRRSDADRLGVGASEVALLPTPVAHADGKSPEAHMRMKANMPGGARAKATDLRVVLAMLPTPTARLGTPRGAQADRYKNPERSNDLDDDAAAWAEREARWGDYAPAIKRWESVIGREAPAPLDGKRLSPDFVEWMMGYEAGWTEGLSRTARLKCLGNAVVTRQAAYALDLLTTRSLEAAA